MIFSIALFPCFLVLAPGNAHDQHAIASLADLSASTASSPSSPVSRLLQTNGTAISNSTSPTDDDDGHTHGNGCECSNGMIGNCDDPTDEQKCSCDVLGFVFCMEEEKENETGGEEDGEQHELGCYCDGPGILHCANEADEAGCVCNDSGILMCASFAEQYSTDCHCHGDVHCMDVANEDRCMCGAGDVLMCQEGDGHGGESAGDGHEHDCHCDGPGVVHCTDEADELLCGCDMAGLLVCGEDLGCHCDGSSVHCTSTQDEQYCSCASGSMECNFSERPVGDGSKPWAEVIVSALIINLVTLVGVFVLAGEYLRKVLCPSMEVPEGSVIQWKFNIIPMFAAGALLATSFFLIFPEALHMIGSEFGGSHEGHDHRLLQEEESHDGEAAATWRFGASILGGFMIPLVSHLWFPHVDDLVEINQELQREVRNAQKASEEATAKPSEPKDSDVSCGISSKEEEGEKADPEEDAAKEVSNENVERAQYAEEAAVSTGPDGAQNGSRRSRFFNKSLMASLFIGDFFHNFADGVFLGTAWLLCSRDLAITISAATIFHELPQEIADYLLFINQCGLKPWEALLLNFSCGLSIMIGGLLVLVADLSQTSVGVILCIGGGVYLHLSIGECLPTAENVQKTISHKVYGLVAFVCGCIPIGLVLLNHEHCGGH